MQNSSIFQLYLSYYYFIDPSISTSFSILKVKKINQNYLLKKREIIVTRSVVSRIIR